MERQYESRMAREYARVAKEENNPLALCEAEHREASHRDTKAADAGISFDGMAPAHAFARQLLKIMQTWMREFGSVDGHGTAKYDIPQFAKLLGVGLDLPNDRVLITADEGPITIDEEVIAAVQAASAIKGLDGCPALSRGEADSVVKAVLRLVHEHAANSCALAKVLDEVDPARPAAYLDGVIEYAEGIGFTDLKGEQGDDDEQRQESSS